MKLKKSYKGFIIWMICYMLAETSVVFLPVKDSGLLARICMIVTALGIVLLTLIIYLTENIFWYSGMPYETALNAGSEARKLYAFRHLKLFGIFTAAYLLFSTVMQLLHLSIWIDIVVFTVGITVAAICSMRIKL